MIKEAIDRLIGLAEIRTIEAAGRLWVKGKDNVTYLKAPEEQPPKPIKIFSLGSMISYLAINPDGLDLEKINIHIAGPRMVEVYSALMPKMGNIRFTYMQAFADVPAFQFDQYMPLEDFILGLQACFKSNDDLLNVVLMLSNLANETIRQNQDDGFTQTLQIKTGLTTKSEVKVKNPVRLVPLRTFREVEQPSGDFILRLRNNGNAAPMVALFGSDTTTYDLQAMDAIAKYLQVLMGELKIDVDLIV